MGTRVLTLSADGQLLAFIGPGDTVQFLSTDANGRRSAMVETCRCIGVVLQWTATLATVSARLRRTLRAETNGPSSQAQGQPDRSPSA